MSEKTNNNNKILLQSPNEKKNKLEKSQKRKIILPNKLLNIKELRQKEDDSNFDYSDDLLLNENIELSPIILNPIPCFTVKSDSSQKEISTQVTLYSNITKNNNINLSDNKEDKTKILNKNLKKSHINRISNNRYFRLYSPVIGQNQKLFKSQNPELITTYNIITDNNINNNQSKYEIFLNNKKKFINNINKKNVLNTKNIIPTTINNNNIINNKRHKFLNHLYFSTENFYELKLSEENWELIEEKKEKKKRMMKLIGQKINVANMKIEILQNYKKNKNLNSIKKQIEYNRIFCNNDLKRLKDKYYNNINKNMNQIKYLKIKLIKYKDDYIPLKKHEDIINKEEILFKIKKIELIEKILYLKKKINDLINTNITTYDTFNLDLDDSFEEQTIKNVSFNDYSILKDTMGGINNFNNYNNNTKKGNKNKNNIINRESFPENKIIKVNQQHQINFFKAKFINK